jgi:small subunit ribosomal protein S20
MLAVWIKLLSVSGEIMPHTRSARKNLRKTEKRRLHNRAVLRTLKTYIKKVFAFDEKGTIEELTESVRVAVKRLDKAAAKRIVHANLASRKKAQLDHFLNEKKAAKAAPPKA